MRVGRGDLELEIEDGGGHCGGGSRSGLSSVGAGVEEEVGRLEEGFEAWSLRPSNELGARSESP